MTDLPIGWQPVALGDLGTWYGGGTPSKGRSDFWSDGTVPWLSPKDMSDAVIRSTQDRITEAAVGESAVRRVPPGSVALVVRSGILERALPIAVVPIEVTLNQDMKALVPRRDIDPRWVAWGLRNREQALLRQCRKAGTTVASIDTKRLLAEVLPVPPLDEQRRIVEILEDHLSRLDAAVRYLNDCGTRVRSLLESALQHAFLLSSRPSEVNAPTLAELFDQERRNASQELAESRRLTAAALPGELTDLRVPPGWLLTTLESVTSPTRVIRYGILMPRVRAEGRVPYVEVKDLAGNTLHGKVLHRTSVELDEQFSGSRIQCGDVLIAVRGSYERTALVPEDYAGSNISRDVARIAPLPSLMPEYLHMWLQSPWVKRYLHRHARGVAVKGVNIGTLRKLPIIVPDLHTQRDLVTALRATYDAGSRVLGSIEAQRTRQFALRKAVLLAAFSGRLIEGATDLHQPEELARV